MGKKIILVLILAISIAGGVSAQERAKNTITGGLNFFVYLPFGLDIEYERVLINNFLGKGLFSITVDVGYYTLIFFDSSWADVHARWYPWSRTFFLDVGLGCMANFWTSAFTISPKVGWKIDIGKPNGWVIIPSIAASFFVTGEGWPISLYPVNFLPKIDISIGYSF
jgi:hypothetical protein